MFIRNLRSGRRLAALAIFSVIAVSAFGFAEANTFNGGTDAGRAGDGSGTISGYNVTNIRYNLNEANPSNLDSVTFDLDASATNVKARVNAGTWATCTGGPTTDWTCNVGGTVASATSLQVVAAD